MRGTYDPIAPALRRETDEMILTFDNLVKHYRIVDLSVTVVPGTGSRRMEVRRGIIPSDGTIMHEVDTMSHVGTHIEAPSHFFEDGKDVTDLPLSACMGDAVLVDIHCDAPGIAIDPTLLEQELGSRLRPGHILVMRNTGKVYSEHRDKPAITREAADWLVQKGIKMVAFDPATTIGRTREETREVHRILMSRDITLLEVLSNLHELTQREFFLIALPWKVKGLDSSPVRAIALERR